MHLVKILICIHLEAICQGTVWPLLLPNMARGRGDKNIEKKDMKSSRHSVASSSAGGTKRKQYDAKDERKVSSKLARCSCCGALSSDKQWKDTKASGSAMVAVGDACEDCHDIHNEGFSFMPWAEFCQRFLEHIGFHNLVQ